MIPLQPTMLNFERIEVSVWDMQKWCGLRWPTGHSGEPEHSNHLTKWLFVPCYDRQSLPLYNIWPHAFLNSTCNDYPINILPNILRNAPIMVTL